MLHPFNYVAPKTRSEFLGLLSEHGPKAKVLAGGTDLLVNIRAGILKPAFVLDAKRVEGYAGISWSSSEGLSFHPATTINEVLRDTRVREDYPLIAACGHDLASYQIRNRATVIGNVVNASPCSDMAPALLCLGARAVIASSGGQRTVPFSEFFVGVKKTVLKSDEILERIIVPAESAGARGEYRKLKRINGHDLGIVGVAVAHVGKGLRIAVSSAAPTPILVDSLAVSASADEAVAAALAAVSPISDVRCTKEYRLFMIETFIRRLMEEMK